MSQRGHRTNKSEAVSACPSLTAAAEHIWYPTTEDSPGVAQTVASEAGASHTTPDRFVVFGGIQFNK